MVGSRFVVVVSLLPLALCMLSACSAAENCNGTLSCAEGGETATDGADASARSPLLMPNSDPFAGCGSALLLFSPQNNIEGACCKLNGSTPGVYKKYILPGQSSFQGWYKCRPI